MPWAFGCYLHMGRDFRIGCGGLGCYREFAAVRTDYDVVLCAAGFVVLTCTLGGFRSPMACVLFEHFTSLLFIQMLLAGVPF